MANSVNNETALDLRDEYRELDAVCATLGREQWHLRSAFYGWTPWDEVAHLCYFDEASLHSINDPERFAAEAAALSGRMARGEQISAIARDRYRHHDGPGLLEYWRSRYEALSNSLAAMDPKARLLWYGPSMSARSFTTARMMETWAHGQDVWDVLRRRRRATNRLQHIAHLGVTTFGWTFANRNLPVPAVAPHVRLDAPHGAIWSWGDEASEHRVAGTAEDFCLLVTQRRHVDDTGLQYTAGPVSDWLHIAQCFAGPPADGPKSGERKVVY